MYCLSASVFLVGVCDLLACFYKVFADLINVSVISKSAEISKAAEMGRLDGQGLQGTGED